MPEFWYIKYRPSASNPKKAVPERKAICAATIDEARAAVDRMRTIKIGSDIYVPKLIDPSYNGRDE